VPDAPRPPPVRLLARDRLVKNAPKPLADGGLADDRGAGSNLWLIRFI